MNLVVNSDESNRMEPIEGEILSTNGRVKLLEIDVPPYPKLLHVTRIDKKMIVQKKINGYNVRLVFVPKLDNFIAVLRGGYVCAKTTSPLRRHFSELFMKFFLENPKKILCLEVLGRKSLANQYSDYFEENYGFGEIGYFVFDIMDTEKDERDRFFAFSDVERTCKKYNLNLIPSEGVFENLDDLNKHMQKLPDVFEGVVVKSLDGKDIMKYRFDDRPDLFRDKVPEKEERIIPPEERIVAHFFQGYEEQELGLESGISQEEVSLYNKKIDAMRDVILNDKTKIGEESNKLTKYLLEKIQEHGAFEPEMLQRLEKMFKSKISGEVGKILRLDKKAKS